MVPTWEQSHRFNVQLYSMGYILSARGSSGEASDRTTPKTRQNMSRQSVNFLFTVISFAASWHPLRERTNFNSQYSFNAYDLWCAEDDDEYEQNTLIEKRMKIFTQVKKLHQQISVGSSTNEVTWGIFPANRSWPAPIACNSAVPSTCCPIFLECKHTVSHKYEVHKLQLFSTHHRWVHQLKEIGLHAKVGSFHSHLIHIQYIVSLNCVIVPLSQWEGSVADGISFFFSFILPSSIHHRSVAAENNEQSDCSSGECEIWT